MKTKIVFTENPSRISVREEWEKLFKKSLFLSLKEKGKLNQKQYEECLKRI